MISEFVQVEGCVAFSSSLSILAVFRGAMFFHVLVMSTAETFPLILVPHIFCSNAIANSCTFIEGQVQLIGQVGQSSVFNLVFVATNVSEILRSNIFIEVGGGYARWTTGGTDDSHCLLKM